MRLAEDVIYHVTSKYKLRQILVANNNHRQIYTKLPTWILLVLNLEYGTLG